MAGQGIADIGPSRRTVMAGLPLAAAGMAGSVLALFPAEAPAEAIPAPARPEDAAFMREALVLAEQSNHPYGAVITRGAEVLARGRNQVAEASDPTAHAEMTAIRSFLAERGPDGMRGATIYATVEPCMMCMGAILWCGFGRVVYGASLDDLSPYMGRGTISAQETASQTLFLKVELTGGVLAAESVALFEQRKDLFKWHK
ncbi:nucleoside deaminase [Xanthobacter pseudotagetidis]|uniref:nucleoside deaminase n=1 Tax=Xanthobacter pseudotagetidis TaxID=3119911 RepID=UPI00372AE488